MTVAERLVSQLQRAGTRAIFGMPGGGSNLDVIDAARRIGLPFVLAHTETAGAIMAAAQAEITGAPGACLCTLGPGVSSIVNGVAHALLDRVPLIVLTDATEAEGRDRFWHQNLPHAKVLGPVTRWSAELMPERAAMTIDEALTRACADPPGPVHLDCGSSAMAAPLSPAEGGRAPDAPPHDPGPVALPTEIRQLVGRARRPLAIVGLGARRSEDAAALRALCDRCRLPVLATYKAKGVIPDDHPSYAGLFTLGEIERPIVERADLIVAVGLDPVELLPRRWPYVQPLVVCSGWAPGTQLPEGQRVMGDVARGLRAVGESLPAELHWRPEEVAANRERQRVAVMTPGRGLSPGGAIAAVAEATRGACHVTVDAGAHMFPAMTLVPADRPGRILISNGLSTMGFALPAAIGAALLRPDAPVVAITGDAGLLMCLGELRTAARERLRVIAIVMADDELSLIRIKQDRRGLQPEGVRIGDMDWVAVAHGMGWRGARASDAARLSQQVAEAMEAEGPSLIEARIDPSGYGDVLRAVRG